MNYTLKCLIIIAKNFLPFDLYFYGRSVDCHSVAYDCDRLFVPMIHSYDWLLSTNDRTSGTVVSA